MRCGETDKNVLIIGYGNVLRRDDGVGVAAAGWLDDHLPPAAANVTAVHQLLPELAEPISRCGLVIFIDADAGLPGGKYRKCSLNPGDTSDRTCGHHQTPQGLLRMAEELYGRTPQALLYSIGGTDFSYGLTLSADVSSTLETVLQDLSDTVSKSAMPGEIKTTRARSELTH